MNVSQLARHAGTTADTVRHYTEIGLLKPRRNPTNGYREYSHADLSRLSFSLQARALGFTLQDISTLTAESEAGQSPCQHTRALIEHRLAEVEARISELTQLGARMRSAMDQWATRPDCEPDHEVVCGLIQSWEQGDHG
ncbi:MAG: MerR family transcriptional regulator [Gammaproteobacteria bacterium HGW-Gammaproteobacteria-14]|nr:MAG: MerR family transcriptional regulator [Gammaproteobacteria bacterium HGW-Gammaproteobacteria-14]